MAKQRPVLGFWAVAFAFLVVMALATLPSPLYGLYRTRDHLSDFMITVVFAIFAGGTIITLLGECFITTRLGRRGAFSERIGPVVTTRRRRQERVRSPWPRTRLSSMWSER